MSSRARSQTGALTGTMADLLDTSGRDVPELHLSPRRQGKKRVNLKAVSEVLAEHGLDPTVEITKILLGIDDDGNPVLDKDGNPAGSQLDTDTRSRVLLELLQYTQPKLKSMEIRAKIAATAFDVNDDQAKRIAEEFLKIGVDQAVS